MRTLIIINFCLILFASCKKNKTEMIILESLVEVPSHFPEIDYPADNHPTKSRIELGRRLFYEKALSKDYSISCADCHFAEQSFSDTIALSLGVDAVFGLRNSPPLHNLAYHPYFFKDGGVPTLEFQIKAPIEDSNEMDLNILVAAERLSILSNYNDKAKLAYNRDIDSYVITRSIACFLRTILSGNSNYDKHQKGEIVLDSIFLVGQTLFNGQGKCIECHSGHDFTNYQFENTGLYTYYQDSGRARVTYNSLDNGKFKVPSLRNITETAPYMHDGSFETLREVLLHYQSNGKNHLNKNSLINQINLSNSDLDALEVFLTSLTDTEFLLNPKYKNP